MTVTTVGYPLVAELSTAPLRGWLVELAPFAKIRQPEQMHGQNNFVSKENSLLIFVLYNNKSFFVCFGCSLLFRTGHVRAASNSTGKIL